MARKKATGWLLLSIISFAALLGTLFYYIGQMEKGQVPAHADATIQKKDYKWIAKAVEEGTNVDALYLWPDESNPVFTAVYRDGSAIEDEHMITISSGSVYHFRGQSDTSILYAEVYVGNTKGQEVMSEESAMWYSLLPNSVRTSFEQNGWTWNLGWEYTGRAYLDSDNKCIRIKTEDAAAVLYGIGLYLTEQQDYLDDPAFEQESSLFTEAFGETENIFASALEYYYTKGGELRAKCPKIYAMIADILKQLDPETSQIRESTITAEVEESEENQIENENKNVNLLTFVNEKRLELGLSSVVIDTADTQNALVRAKEVSVQFSQIRPNGEDAFTAYTDAVMCEMRLENPGEVEDIYDMGQSYFQMPGLTSFTYAEYQNASILVFVWE